MLDLARDRDLTWKLAIFLMLNGFVLNVFLWSVSPPTHGLAFRTVLDTAWHVFDGYRDDSWKVMGRALDYLAGQNARPLYAELFFTQGLKFQYPPTSLFFYAPIRDHHYTLILIDVLFVTLTIGASVALLEKTLNTQYPTRYSIWRAVVVAALAITFYPIIKASAVGQIQVWLTGLFALSLLCWVTRRKVFSGIFIGIVCLVKPHWGVLLLWATLRGEWRFFLACAATFLIGLTISVSLYGVTNHLDYFSVLTYLTQHGEAYYPNQSANGLLNRLMSIVNPGLYNNIEWRGERFPPYHPFVYFGTLFAAVAILGLALFRRARASDPERIFDFCTMALSCTVSSPIAWEHHYGILFPIYAIVFATVYRSSGTLVWIAVSYVLASNLFILPNTFAGTWLNVLQSYLLGGGLILLAVLRFASPFREVHHLEAIRQPT